MKTSNKLLLGLLILIIISISTIIIATSVKIHKDENQSFSGKLVSQIREFQRFSEIKLTGNIQVNYLQGKPQKVFIEADSSLLPYIKTELKGDRLIIRNDKTFPRNKYIQVYVTTDTLNNIDISNGACFKTLKCLKVSKLQLSASAGTILEINGEITDLNADLSAGCMAKFLGVCKNLHLDASAGCIINADSLYTKTASIDASAGTIASLNVSDEISVDASSGAVIHYIGNPNLKNIDISSGAVFQKK